MKESITLDYLISKSSGDTLWFFHPDGFPSIEFLKEAILRGFEICSIVDPLHLPQSFYNAPERHYGFELDDKEGNGHGVCNAAETSFLDRDGFLYSGGFAFENGEGTGH